jgi:hypothetical protein
MKKPALKTPTNDAVAKMAPIIVSKEISRLLGTEGAQQLIRIGAHMLQIKPLYEAYFDAVDAGTINLETIRNYFSPEAWAMLQTPAKLRALETAIRKEVENVKKIIGGHMAYLNKYAQQLETLGPEGQAALQLVLLELTGEAPPVVSEPEHWANGDTCAKCGTTEWTMRDKVGCDVCHQQQGRIAA